MMLCSSSPCRAEGGSSVQVRLQRQLQWESLEHHVRRGAHPAGCGVRPAFSFTSTLLCWPRSAGGCAADEVSRGRASTSHLVRAALDLGAQQVAGAKVPPAILVHDARALRALARSAGSRATGRERACVGQVDVGRRRAGTHPGPPRTYITVYCSAMSALLARSTQRVATDRPAGHRARASLQTRAIRASSVHIRLTTDRLALCGCWRMTSGHPMCRLNQNCCMRCLHFATPGPKATLPPWLCIHAE